MLVNVTFVDDAGQSTTVEFPDGWNLMQAATANGVDGILGECGGSCTCATCHCYIEEDHLNRLPAASDMESRVLDCASAERRPNSRLACQIRSNAALEGLIVRLPPTQL